MRILLIEDEVKLAKAIEESLSRLGYSIAIAHSGEEGYFLATTQAFDMLILDLNLPGRDGIEILKGLKSTGLSIPVLILTARDGIDDRVTGLDSGADDYLIKPFAFAELHARLRAIVRRGRSDETSKLKCADLELDRITHKVTRGGQTIELTGKEYELLEFLMMHQGHIVTREMLAKEIWGERARVVPLDNVIDVHMTRLRSKIDSSHSPTLIKTRRGLGFILQIAD